MAWLRRIFRRKRRRVVVTVGGDLYRVYEIMANREGLTVSEWAKRLLTNAIPKRELKMLNHAALRAAGMDAVYAQLDQDESVMLGMLPMSAPVPAPSRAPAVPGHPCIHLRAEYPNGYSAKTCQGICAAQDGRVCHWNPPVATQCPVFEPRFKLPLAATR